MENTLENTVVVFIDPESRKIYLFGAYNRPIDFEDASYLLPIFLKDKDILYISQIEETDKESVMEVIDALMEGETQKPRFLHCKINKYVNVVDAGFAFSGIKDVKALDKIGVSCFSKSPTLQKLLLDDSIEIIDEEKAKKIRINIPDQKTKDKALDEIILKQSVSAFAAEDAMFDEMDEITSEQEEPMTEAEEILKRIKP